MDIDISFKLFEYYLIFFAVKCRHTIEHTWICLRDILLYGNPIVQFYQHDLMASKNIIFAGTTAKFKSWAISAVIVHSCWQLHMLHVSLQTLGSFAGMARTFSWLSCIHICLNVQAHDVEPPPGFRFSKNAQILGRILQSHGF